MSVATHAASLLHKSSLACWLRSYRRRQAARPCLFWLCALLVVLSCRRSALLFTAARSWIAWPALAAASRCNGAQRHRARLLRRPAAGSAGATGPVEIAQQWWNDTTEFFDALEFFNNTPLVNDTRKEAVELKRQMDLWNSTLLEVRERAKRSGRVQPGDNERVGALFAPLPGLAFAYYRMRVTRTLSKKVVRKGLSSGLVYGNIALVAVFLRVVAPRILAAGNSDEIFNALGAVGIPSKATLAQGLDYIRNYDGTTKIVLYTLAFVLEKMTMVSDILPLQIALKTVSPLIFGGLVQGALASAVCETLGACCNFAIGRAFLTTRLREFAPFGGEPVGKATWFGALERSAKEDGSRVVLLLRLAPVIPLPFDSYWYLFGALSVTLSDFAAGHFLGCLKTSFLDASFGELLLTTMAPDTVQAQAQQIVVTETVAFTVVALLVSTVATRLANDLFDEELYPSIEGQDAPSYVDPAGVPLPTLEPSVEPMPRERVAKRAD